MLNCSNGRTRGGNTDCRRVSHIHVGKYDLEASKPFVFLLGGLLTLSHKVGGRLEGWKAALISIPEKQLLGWGMRTTKRKPHIRPGGAASGEATDSNYPKGHSSPLTNRLRVVNAVLPARSLSRA